MTVSLTLIHHDKIEFVDRSSNVCKRKRAYKIGEHLAVSYVGISEHSYQVFSISSGKPILNAQFPNIDDAIKFAEWIDEVYRDYLPILETYPDADIFALVKWSVRNGLRIYETVRQINSKPVELPDIALAYERSHQMESHWKRNFTG
jgi:hypothetical protein